MQSPLGTCKGLTCMQSPLGTSKGLTCIQSPLGIFKGLTFWGNLGKALKGGHPLEIPKGGWAFVVHITYP